MKIENFRMISGSILSLAIPSAPTLPEYAEVNQLVVHESRLKRAVGPTSWVDMPKDPLFPFYWHTFTHTGLSGPVGPTLSSCLANYLSAGAWKNNVEFFNVVHGVQQFRIPESGIYELMCRSASSNSYSGRIDGRVQLEQGDVLFIVVGQQGLGVDISLSSSQIMSLRGGNGATMVYSAMKGPLIIVGGQGGHVGSGGSFGLPGARTSFTEEPNRGSAFAVQSEGRSNPEDDADGGTPALFLSNGKELRSGNGGSAAQISNSTDFNGYGFYLGAFGGGRTVTGYRNVQQGGFGGGGAVATAASIYGMVILGGGGGYIGGYACIGSRNGTAGAACGGGGSSYVSPEITNRSNSQDSGSPRVELRKLT